MKLKTVLMLGMCFRSTARAVYRALRLHLRSAPVEVPLPTIPKVLTE
jgi:hypothetical protein